MMQARRIGVLFVCHANMCRSPLAEAIFVHRAAARGVAERFAVESAGTWAAEGVAPHPGSVEVARARGIVLAGRSRCLVPADLQCFSEVIAMDRANEADIARLARISPSGALAGESTVRVRLLRAVAEPAARGAAVDVPDPVRGGPEAFASAFEIIERGCIALLDELCEMANI